MSAKQSPNFPDSTGIWVVVGLGNPGAKYAATRHNVGQMVIETLLTRWGASLSAHRSNMRVAQLVLGMDKAGNSQKIVLAVSNSYMNESGGPVKALLKWLNAAPMNLLVLHDELDLPFASLRLKIGGGENGHNGLRSISQALGTRDYARLRLGIGRPNGQQDPADFVLRPFAKTELDDLGVSLELAADTVEQVVKQGFTAAQMNLHTQSK